MDESGRILSLEAQLEDARRAIVAHDFLLRALLSHLALNDPDAFRGLVDGFAQTGFYRPDVQAPELAREVAHELTDLLDEVAATVAARRGGAA
jgi:hypothetical protein